MTSRTPENVYVQVGISFLMHTQIKMIFPSWRKEDYLGKTLS